MKENEKPQRVLLWNRYGIYFLMLVVVVLLIIALTPAGSDSAPLKDIVLQNSAEAHDENVMGDGSTFKRNEDTSVYNLIDNYYNALMANDDVQLMRYVDEVAKVPAAQRVLYSVYVEAVDSLDTYVIAGLVSRSYVVAGISYIKIKGVETPVPVMERFFVLTNESGNIYITTKELNESMTAYNELMYENTTIANLTHQIALEYDQVLDKEPGLKEIFASLLTSQETQQEERGQEGSAQEDTGQRETGQEGAQQAESGQEETHQEETRQKETGQGETQQKETQQE